MRDYIERIRNIAAVLTLYTSLAENRSYSHRDINERLTGGFAAISPSQAST